MSPIGKIFAVLNIVMAAVFLGFASNNLSAHKSWSETHAALVKSSGATETELQGTITGLREAAQTLQSDKEELGRDRTALKAENGVLRTDLDDAQKDNSTNKTALDTIAGSLDQYQATNASMQAKADAADAEKVSAIEARHGAEGERDDAKEAEGQAREALAKANKDIASLERQRESLRKDKTGLETQLATIVELTHIDINKLKSMPALNGQVLQVVNTIEPGLVSINLGSDDGVQRGFTFDVWAGNTYKGRVRVESVRAGMCTALITNPVEDTQIAGGDKAATRL